MSKLNLKTLTLVFLFPVLSCRAGIINISANSYMVNADATQAGDPNNRGYYSLFLNPGSYTLSLESPDTHPNAIYYAWCPWPAWATDTSWRTNILIGSGNNANTVGDIRDDRIIVGMLGEHAYFPSPQTAFEGILAKTEFLIITKSDELHFWFADNYIVDNQGGVSVWVQLNPTVSAPEPSQSLLGGCSVILGAAYLMTRRSRSLQC